MLSIHGKKSAPVSTHGKALLLELLTPASANLEVALSYIEKDSMAGRLKDPDTGNNSYHLLLGNDHTPEFVLTVLKALLEKCPEGVRAVNNKGSLPLHLCLSQQDIIFEAAGLLLKSYPAAAGHSNNQGWSPLFLCVMRDNSDIHLCRAICQSFPAAPSTLNKTLSLPLHFASKRWRPNKELLKLLLKRHPGGAAIVNEFGFLPLHCACATTDDMEAVKMIYEAYPDAIKTKDRQGKTCLHLAVLAVGQDHEQAIIREEEQEKMQRELEAKLMKMNTKKAEGKGTVGGGIKKKSAAAIEAEKRAEKMAENDSDYDEDESDEKEKERSQLNEMNEREGSRSRRVIQFLIEQWPEALVTDNNFMATPVETVLEKARRIKSLSRRISVFGLFDDPPTARMLLTAQKYRAERRLLPGLRPRFMSTLRELNWLARRDAILLSSIGERRTKGNTDNDGRIRTTVGGASSSASKTKIKNKSDAKQVLKDKEKNRSSGNKNNKDNKDSKNGGSGENDEDDSNNLEIEVVGSVSNVIMVSGDEDIPRNNILARFRRRGYIDIVRQVISWI